MHKYKAVIIDFKKILHKSGILALAGMITVVAMYTSGLTNKNTDLEENIRIAGIDTKNSLEKIADRGRNIADGCFKILFGFVPMDESSVIKSAIPVYAAVTSNVLNAVVEQRSVESTDLNAENINGRIATNTAENTNVTDIANIKEENRAPIKSIDGTQKTSQNSPVAIGNETSYGININEMLSQRPNIDMKSKGAKVLIIHTHATESYAPDGAEIYDITASDRSDDKNKNVVAVGKRMTEVFERCGIGVIHDEILHDKPSFNGSYAHSLNTTEQYMKENPSLQIVLDIHRDSIVYDDKTKVKTVTAINGKNAAQLMFVVGTDENGLYNPNWRSNMRAAIHFQKCIADKYPKLMRHINLRKERFNGHTSSASMIIEVGTSGNSLEEAMYSIELATECIADYLNNL